MNNPSETNASPKTARAAARKNAFTKRYLPWILGGALALLIVVGLWPKPVPVETATVVRGPLVVTVNEEGRTQVRNRYVVTAPVAGQMRRVEHKAGASVRAGETVLTFLETAGASILDARSLAQAQASVSAAESAREMAAAQVERARAADELAQADFVRAKELLASGTLSQAEYDAWNARAIATAQERRAAGFALQVAGFELEQAKALLLRGTEGDKGQAGLPLFSPVDGRVLRVMQESARVVPAGFPILEVGDPTDLEVLVEVLSRDGVRIKPGARVWLDQWGGDEPLEARVRWVEPSAFTKFSALGVEEQRVNVIADLTTPLEERPTLGDGFRVEARIVTREDASVLKVPSGALFQRGGAWRAYAVRGGRAREVEVGVLPGGGRETAITSGLAEGDTVINFPGDQVRDGVRVRVGGATR
jgi:HlyD family secretion protein